MLKNVRIIEEHTFTIDEILKALKLENGIITAYSKGYLNDKQILRLDCVDEIKIQVTKEVKK